ncbi:MAG: UMP kinase [Bacilli bacterium]|nr:UMP kinase [Bacilli bacterium]
MAKYKRVLLKISGEALASGQNELILSNETLKAFALTVKKVHDLGVEVAIVCGAGNIWRGKIASSVGMERCNADYMGMLATMINALALQDVLEQVGLQTRVQSALEVNKVAEPYIRRKAVRHLEKGRVLIFAGGTGNPYFSTDTCAALRAAEINADVILMAKNGVDGVYDSDPRTNKDAKMYSSISYMDVISKNLQVMDNTAISLCMNTNMELVVFNMNDMNNIVRVVNGDNIGTIVRKDV